MRCPGGAGPAVRMIAAAHVTAGMIAGVAALSARGAAWRFAIALGLGVSSHVILDTIPHSDYGSLSRLAILAIVAVELIVTFTFAWYLLRPRRLPGLRVTLLPALAGAMLPDAKFAAQWLPEPAASWVYDSGDSFHSWFHVAPTPVRVGLSAEITCTLLLLVGLWLIVRRNRFAPTIRGV